MTYGRVALTAVALTFTVGLAACDGRRDPSGASTPSAGHEHADRGEPSPGDTPGHHDPYAEAAEKFDLPKDKIGEALIAARLEMLRRGGEAGEKLAGTDDEPTPLNQGGHLDPAVLAVFTGKLQVPADRAQEVMKFLLGEWNEYDRDAEKNNPGTYTKIKTYVAEQLKITPARAAWVEVLLISRAVPPGTTFSDPIFDAVAAALGITAERLAQAVDGAKMQS
jgi:hypothetical protein